MICDKSNMKDCVSLHFQANSERSVVNSGVFFYELEGV